MNKNLKIEAAMEKARAMRADVKRLGGVDYNPAALETLAYRVVCLEERLANCRCKKTKETRP